MFGSRHLRESGEMTLDKGETLIHARQQSKQIVVANHFFFVSFRGRPRFTFPRGVFQYGERHFAHRTGVPSVRRTHSAPQRRQRQIMLG